MKQLRLALIGALAAIGWSTFAHAGLTTYTYTAPITSWYDATGHNWQLYAGLNSDLRFEFTTATPLVDVNCGPNQCQTNILPRVLSWRYNGGSPFMNLSSSTHGTLTGLTVNTDANGNILADRFYVNGTTVIPGLEDYDSSFTQAHDGYDQQVLYSTYARFVTYGYLYAPIYGGLAEGMSNTHGAGSWSMRVDQGPGPQNQIPEPATWTIVLAGLAGLTIMMRRHRTESSQNKPVKNTDSSKRPSTRL